MKRITAMILAVWLLLSLAACGQESSQENGRESAPERGTVLDLDAERKPATPITAERNAEVYQLLDFEDTREGEFANRGFLAAPDSLVIKTEDGALVWSQDAYGFVRGDQDAPAEANPSLWRNTQYNALYGLFEVTEDIYQVRGYDLANITFVRSRNGWIIMDCGSSKYTETAENSV